MMHSLRWRLLLLIITVLAIAGGLAATLAAHAINSRFRDYFEEQQAASLERREHVESILPQVLAAYYAQNLSWDEVDKLLEDFGELIEEGIVLSNADGQVVLDSAYLRAGTHPGTTTQGYTIPISISDRVVGEVRVIPIPHPVDSVREQAVIASVNRSLLWAILAATAIAVALTLVVSRHILHPVEALTEAARKMEQGDLRQRVEVQSVREISELAHAFNAMADSRTRIDQLRRNMVSDVAHELRTPLSNIRGYLEGVLDGVIDPTPDLMASLFEEAMLLNHLVDDLQELALVEAGQLKMSRQAVDLSELIDKVTQIAWHPQQNSNVALRVLLPDSLPTVQVDAERIGQVLRNLISNALTHTPPGGEVRVAAACTGEQVTVTVANTGAGIAREHLPYVFERFYRVDGSRTRSTGGSGLGLAIVKQLVEAHGGHVGVESEPGRWTHFRFTLPVPQGG